MTSLDDKLLGERTENYCSSSEEERDDEVCGEEGVEGGSPLVKNSALSSSKIDINDKNRWKGYSQNTGPKGVIRDWQLYKEHQEELRAQGEAKLVEEIKKSSISCKAFGEDAEIEELMSDEVLKGFVDKRMGELMKLREGGGGKVVPFRELSSGDEFVSVIDEFGGREESVVILIYDEGCLSLRLLECLREVSLKYRECQFCYVRGDCVGVSSLFKRKGVPALLVYSKGELVGNFVGVCSEIGEEFDAEDLCEWMEGKGVFRGRCLSGGVRGE